MREFGVVLSDCIEALGAQHDCRVDETGAEDDRAADLVLLER